MPNDTHTERAEELSNALLTRTEAAHLRGQSDFTLDRYRQLRTHGIVRGPDFVRRGRFVLYPRRGIDAWLAKQEGGGPVTDTTTEERSLG